MPFRNNGTLIRTAATVDVVANGAGNEDLYSGAGGATAFVVANGITGDDTFEDFGSDDSIITDRAIFDGNGDGFIAFGPNGVLDADRTGGGAANAGPDQYQVVGPDGNITEIRFLGSKDGGFAYADSATLRQLGTTFGDTNIFSDTNAGTNVVEGTVGDDTINAGAGSTIILQDNALGLNLGGDFINGFGDDDLLVTTALLFDAEGDGDIEFFTNLVLDVSGAEGANSADPSQGPGGQLDFEDDDLQAVVFLGQSEGANGVTYYYYGTAGSTVDLPTFD